MAELNSKASHGHFEIGAYMSSSSVNRRSIWMIDGAIITTRTWLVLSSQRLVERLKFWLSKLIHIIVLLVLTLPVCSKCAAHNTSSADTPQFTDTI
jgi:hypothetical protein